MTGIALPYFDRALLDACFAGRAGLVRRLLQRRIPPNPAEGWSGLMLGWCATGWTDYYVDGWSAKSALREIVIDLLDAGLLVSIPTEDDQVTALVREWKSKRGLKT